MKTKRYLMLALLFLFTGCAKKEDGGSDNTVNETSCLVDEGTGAPASMTSTDPSVSFNGDTTEIDNSFTVGRWLWFQVKGQLPGTYTLGQTGDRAIYNNTANVEFSTISGTMIFTSVDKAAKKLTGTFNNMKLVSPSGLDTVTITNGTLNIDN